MTYTVEHIRPTDPGEATEFDHFMSLLPTLRETHPGDYVAVCGGQVVARNEFASVVYDEGMSRAEGRPVYHGWIDPPGGVEIRNGVVELLEDA